MAINRICWRAGLLASALAAGLFGTVPPSVLRADDPPSKPEANRDGKSVKDALNDLKQLAVAVHRFNDTYGFIPPAANRDSSGKLYLSWRVLILPYIDQKELYKEFKLDEPWDSEHNKKLIAKMPRIYQGPNKKLSADGKTVILAPVAKETAFPPDGKKIRIPASFLDGTSNTILFVEGNDDSTVIWTKPDDLKVDPKKPHQGLLRPGQDFFLVAMADGSSLRVANSVTVQTLAYAFDPADGMVLGEDWPHGKKPAVSPKR
jgi:hypothetical protein